MIDSPWILHTRLKPRFEKYGHRDIDQNMSFFVLISRVESSDVGSFLARVSSEIFPDAYYVGNTHLIPGLLESTTSTQSYHDTDTANCCMSESASRCILSYEESWF